MSFTRFSNGGGGGGGAQGFSRFLSDSSTENNPYSIDKIQKQIENNKLRISDAGKNPEDSNQRNWFEEATNLPAGQNWFFDALELLGRGGNAVKNVADKSIMSNRQELGTALYRGLSGRDKVSGADLAKKAGIENKVGQFAAGLGADILLDPTTYIPGGVIAKGVTTAAKPVAGAAKTAYNALEAASPALKGLRETKLQPAAESAKDALGYMFKPDYKKSETLFGTQDDFLKNLELETENSRRFMKENYMTNLSDTAKSAGGLEKGTDVGRLMEKDLRQFEDVKAYEFPDGLKVTENKQDLYDAINANREQIKGIGKEIGGSKREYQGAIGEMSSGLNKTDADIRKLYFGLERQATKDLDKQTKTNIRDAGRELARVDSQINNFGQVEDSMLRNYKKQIAASHESNFDIIKRVREAAPNGIKGVNRAEMPASLQNFVRHGGKGIDEVANELGYKYADELVQDLKHLNNVPRKIDDETLTQLARQEMERTGAVKFIEDQFNALTTSKQTLQQSIKDIQKGFRKELPGKASEKAFADIANNERYIELTNQRNTLKSQLDSLKGESKQASDANLANIKQIEDEISALKEASRNPVMIQKQIERPVREMPTDPNVIKAAKSLVNANAEIRQFAADKGIEIPELAGYMTHILTQEEKARRSVKKVMSVERGQFGTGNPNSKILSQRKLQGSAEDINQEIGRDFFNTNAFFSTGIGQQRLLDYVHAVDFRRKVLSNQNFAQPFKKGMDIGKNVVIDTNNYKFLKESGDALEGMNLADKVGGEYVVTPQVKMMLDRYQHINTDEGTKAFMKAYGAIQTTWKKLALFSPGYHIRNVAGNLWNNYIGGMSPKQLVQYSGQAANEVKNALRGKESELFREYRSQGLASTGLNQVEFGKGLSVSEKSIEDTIKRRSASGLDKAKQAVKQPFKTSQDFGDTADQVSRFAMYKWSRDKGMSPQEAAAKVKETLFDYTALTPFEQKVMRNLVPFYTWSRKNIPFQIQKFIEDPRKFQNINKARLNAQDAVGLDDNNMPEYMKEQFNLPLYGKDGKGKSLGLNLPLTDLLKLSNPLKIGVDGLTPLIKTPIELATNYNMFRGKPIQKFEGQEKQFDIGGVDLGGIPVKTAYALEQATGQIGRGLSDYLQKDQKDNDDTFRTPTLGISSFLKPFDAEEAKRLEQLQQLRQLQDLILYIEQQQGSKPRTVNEIKKSR